MIPDVGSLAQAALGTLFTWCLTAAGAAVVVVFPGSQIKLLHSSLGFAAGVMLAASYWSLLSPAIEMAEQSQHYGLNGEYAFLPVSVGFLFGGLFVYLTDMLISSFGLCAPQLLLAMHKDAKKIKQQDAQHRQHSSTQMDLPFKDMSYSNFHKRKTSASENYDNPIDLDIFDAPQRSLNTFSSSDPTSLNHHYGDSTAPFCSSTLENPRVRTLSKSQKFNRNQKQHANITTNPQNIYEIEDYVGDKSYQLNSDSLGSTSKEESSSDQWKRIVLLIVAITVHNIPEGLAVGVGFGAIGSAPSATFENARNLAIGIGIQNFPEGLAVSLPLKAVGFSLWKSFWYGQLSGMVEPIFGILGAVAVSLAQPLLPYALSFAAGAMIYVVVDDIIPEATSGGSAKLATSATIIGFIVMMALDVGLGG